MGLKSFAASNSKTASVDSSLKIVSISSAALDLVSCLAHTCSDRANETTSFVSNDGLTFPVILQRVSPNHISRKPGFLSRGMSRRAKNASVETVDTSVRILIKYAIDFLRSTFVSTKLFKQNLPSICIHC